MTATEKLHLLMMTIHPYFLGEKSVGATNESKLDLSDIVRDIDELVILNDEARAGLGTINHTFI